MALDFKVFTVRLNRPGGGYVQTIEPLTFTVVPYRAWTTIHKADADKLSEQIPGSVVKVRLIHEETI